MVCTFECIHSNCIYHNQILQQKYTNIGVGSDDTGNFNDKASDGNDINGEISYNIAFDDCPLKTTQTKQFMFIDVLQHSHNFSSVQQTGLSS